MSGIQKELHVRLPEPALRQLKARAALAGREPGDYAEMILRYQFQEEGAESGKRLFPVDSGEVYFLLRLSDVFKQKLVEQSCRRAVNLSAYGGGLITGFLGRFERDPRDLGMIYLASCRTDFGTTVTLADLCKFAAQCEPLGGKTLQAGFASRWFHARLRPLVQHVREGGGEQPFTPDIMAAALAQTSHSGPDLRTE